MCYAKKRASLITQLVKNQLAVQETLIRFLGREDPLEKRKATHTSILDWRILWTVWSMGSQRVRHDRVPFTFTLNLTSGTVGFPGSSAANESACNVGDLVRSLDREFSLKEEMATHSSILAWRIPWTV